MEKVFSPQMSTRLTPSIVCNRSLNRLSAISVSSIRLRVSDSMFRKTIGGALASDFDTLGGSASAGSCCWARLTRSRTSLAARSRSAPSSNSTVTVDCPWRLTDSMVRMPSTPLICSSNGSVIWESITSALAPRYWVLTLMIGGSTAGYSRTPRK
jgi:hypothetical protein